VTGSALRDFAISDISEDGITGDLELALDTSGSGEGSMTLYNLLRSDSRVGLDVVNVLGIVGQQLSLVLQKPDEPMSRGEFLLCREDILGNREEDARILSENVDVKDLLGVAQTEML